MKIPKLDVDVGRLVVSRQFGTVNLMPLPNPGFFCADHQNANLFGDLRIGPRAENRVELRKSRRPGVA